MPVPTTDRDRLPRRRRSFTSLTDETVRALAAPVMGPNVAHARIVSPSQGINNRTYLVHPPAGPGLAVKVRPQARAGVRNSPQWPRYTQALFGPIPNGDISTLLPITRTLAAHGAIRVPGICLVDVSLERLTSPYFIAEELPGVPFDWDAHPVQGPAARQLGRHLGRIHGATAQAEGFGIYARRGEFPRAEWWRRFAHAYDTLLSELARASATMASLDKPLRAALARAVATGAPSSCALICVDQNPTHYLAAPEGTISGMVDIEAHLWAPPEYELAMAGLWVRDQGAFREAYGEHRPWPEPMAQVHPAYGFFTWMEWIYCLHTLLHDHQGATALEEKFRILCGEVMGPFG